MNIFEQIALKIIREQELLMGPVAWNEASKVTGLSIINEQEGIISIEQNSDNARILNDLVNRYENLFGRAGREVCKEAVGALIADLNPSQIPSSLK